MAGIEDNCHRQNNGPQRCSHADSGTPECVTVHGKRDFADVIKDLEIILDYSGEFSLIMWVLKVGEATFLR